MNNIEKRLMELVDEIYTIQIELLNSTDKELQLEEELKKIELDISDTVYNAVDENGKALYSNDAKRKVAIEQAKATNASFNSILAEYKETVKENKISKIKLEKLLNEQSNLRAITRLYPLD